VATAFYARREAEVFAAHLHGAGVLARDACAAHGGAFWRAKSDAAAPEPPPDESARLRTPEVRDALARLRDQDALQLTPGPSLRRTPQPIVRGREIVLEDALSWRDGPALRFLGGVDLVTLADLAPVCRHVPDLHASYCRDRGVAPLASVVAGLAFLVASGALVLRN
jgi:hypothetical protein